MEAVKSETEYPPVGFFFKVAIDGMGDQDTKFQTVSGLSADIETEEIKEGGQNGYSHKLPVKAKFPNLVLKRGMIMNSDVLTWIGDAVGNFAFSPRDVTVTLLNPDGDPLRVWHIVNAYPIKWDPGEFNAEDSKLVIESIELAYNYYTVETPVNTTVDAN
jgi:phage tail-like protein